jgi:hypothetical protein
MKAKAKSSTSKASKSSETGNIFFGRDMIRIKLTAADKKKAARCLEKSGKITFSLKPVSVTKLPQILNKGVFFVD